MASYLFYMKFFSFLAACIHCCWIKDKDLRTLGFAILIGLAATSH